MRVTEVSFENWNYVYKIQFSGKLLKVINFINGVFSNRAKH